MDDRRSFYDQVAYLHLPWRALEPDSLQAATHADGPRLDRDLRPEAADEHSQTSRSARITARSSRPPDRRPTSHQPKPSAAPCGALMPAIQSLTHDPATPVSPCWPKNGLGRKEDMRIFRISAIAVLCTSCSTLTCLSIDRGAYSIKTDTSQPDLDAGLVEEGDVIEVRLAGLRITDAIGNAFERCILESAEVIDKSSIGTLDPVSSTAGDQLSNATIQRLERAVAQAETKADTNSTLTEVSASTLLAQARKAVEDKLLADYRVSTTVRAGDFLTQGADFTHTVSLKQTQLGNPITQRDAVSDIIFRGKAPTILSMTLDVQRDSLLARYFREIIDEASQSTFFEDTFESLVGALPLGAFGARAGAAIGGWIDDEAHDWIERRARPDDEIAHGVFTFVSALDESQPTSISQTLTYGDRTLFLRGFHDRKTKDMATAGVDILAIRITCRKLR